MNRSGVLFVCCTIVIVLLSSCEAQECAGGPHDKVLPCGDLCPNTCEDPGPKFCPAVCLPKSCGCEKGYYRRRDGMCVTLDECKQALNNTSPYIYGPPLKPKVVCTGGPHDIFTPCGTQCPDTCENPVRKSYCSLSCKLNTCQCEKGYYRRSDGRCVTLDQCEPTATYLPVIYPTPPTPKPKVCTGGPHDLVKNCVSLCPATCENPEPRYCATKCKENAYCECEKGYYRRSDGLCVTLDQCEPTATYLPVIYPTPTTPKPKVCTGGPHDLVKNCVSLCPATCENPEPGYCATKCKENAYCECEKGYYRRSDGLCVTLDQCEPTSTYLPVIYPTPSTPKPKVCTGGPHDLVKNCVSLCPATCENPEPGYCATKCKENAYCECEKGYYRRSDGLCVTLDQCEPTSTYLPVIYPTPSTPKPKVCTGGPHDLVKNCVSLCPATCDHPEPRTCAKKCKENTYCECEKGYYRRGDGRCVTLDQCKPKVKPTGYYY